MKKSFGMLVIILLLISFTATCFAFPAPGKYEPKENLWIKGELSFSTLQQCLFQPNERVFVGIIPPTLDRYNKNKQVNIDEISVRRIDTPSNISIGSPTPIKYLGLSIGKYLIA